MPYIIYSKIDGPLAYVEGSILNAHPQEVEILIPCEPGAAANDAERWRAEAVYMEEHGAIAPTLEMAKQVKTEEIAAARYAEETGGVQVNGVPIKTDHESLTMINGAALQATQDPAYTCNWKTEQGFISLTTEQIIAVATAIRQHVQASFDKEAEKMTLIEAAETIEAVQAITWNDSEPEQTA
jgi:hypothetical protein